MIIEQTKLLAHQLRLFGMHTNLERRTSEALAAQMHPLEFFRLLFEDEILARKDRVAKMLATRAGFRSAAEVEDWDAMFDRGIPKARLKELAALGFAANKENLLLFGKTGEGKSHLVVALGRRLARKPYSSPSITSSNRFPSELFRVLLPCCHLMIPKLEDNSSQGVHQIGAAPAAHRTLAIEIGFAIIRRRWPRRYAPFADRLLCIAITPLPTEHHALSNF